MAGQRQILTDDEPVEFAGYPRVEAREDGHSLLVGGDVVVLAEHLPSGARMGTWYDLPSGKGLQLRMLPNGYLQIQTPDCDEEDVPFAPQMVMVPAAEVREQVGEPKHFHVHAIAATRMVRHDGQPHDAAEDGELDLTYGLIGHSEDQYDTLMVALSLGLAAQMIACVEMSAQLNGMSTQLAAEVDQARARTRGLEVEWGSKAQCEAVGPAGGRCWLAEGHPEAGILSELTGGAVTPEGHMWEEATDGTDPKPAAEAG